MVGSKAQENSVVEKDLGDIQIEVILIRWAWITRNN